jgi:SAM-dependent methyltransferase
VGLDYDPIMIEMAGSLAPEIEWRQGDLPDRGAGLRQIHRVLRPGGRMVLATWSDLAKSPKRGGAVEIGRVIGRKSSMHLTGDLVGQHLAFTALERGPCR